MDKNDIDKFLNTDIINKDNNIMRLAKNYIKIYTINDITNEFNMDNSDLIKWKSNLIDDLMSLSPEEMITFRVYYRRLFKKE